MFTSRYATQEQKRAGLLTRIQSRLQRSAKRKELKRPPVAVKNRARAFLFPAFVLTFVVALFFVVQSPFVNMVSDLNFFKIREITITGCRITTPALIRDLAGIRYQASLLKINPAHVEAILRAHPWVSEVEVKRDWPDALVVSVKEYVTEALILQQVSGSRKFFYLDKAGVVFASVEPGQDMDFPVITGLDVKGDKSRNLSQGAGAKDEMLREPLAFLKLVKQNNPNLPIQNLSEIHVDLDAGMTLYLVDYPFPIYFGKGEVRTKYSRLKRVLEVLYKETDQGKTIADVAYIRMDYLENKVLVAHSGSG
ncbi:MAG: FtsQ-type POTRA domain-containing protein [Desulfobulbaceae bacterium]